MSLYDVFPKQPGAEPPKKNFTFTTPNWQDH
jgi:hypothetical protein